MFNRVKSKIQKEVVPMAVNFGRVAKISWRLDRKNALFYSVFMLVQVASNIAAIYFAGQVLNEIFGVLADGKPTTRLYGVFWLSAGLLAVEQVAWRLMGYFQNSSYIAWHTKLAPEFHRKLISLDIARFEDSTYSKLINKVVQDYAWKPANFMFNGLSTIHGCIRLLGTAIALATFSPFIVLILSIIVVPSLLVEMRQSKVKWDIWAVKGDSSRRYHKVTWLMQSKQDIIDMRVFGLVDYLIGFCRRMLDDFNREQQRALMRFIKPAVFVRIGEGAAVGFINFWLIVQVVRETLSVGQYTFYSGMVNQFNSSLGIILSSLGTLYEYNLYMTDYFEFMDTPSLMPESASPKKLASNKPPEIRLENVSFKYPHSDRYVFKNLSLTIKSGQSVALVGENGAGKTTLIKLLLRLYDVNDGAIYLNDVDIRDIELNSWYKQLSALMQDFSRYPFTIEENIHFGRINKPKDDVSVEKAAEMGGVSTFVKDYPLGMQTILDNSFDEGVEPSGGQWQRVALSRAFYRNANVLVLDEPTAAIDANAEFEIFKNITSSQGNKTTIIISHRFSTVRTADHIYVLEDGQIQEHGSHAQLMKQKGQYATMFSKQAEGYK